jgi:nitrate reductase assembly molybdenum cofactor insertion protein NarJ
MNMDARALDPRVRSLLHDAARWMLLGRLFECPGERWRDLAAMAAEVGDADLASAVHAARDEATEGGYHSVFGPGGPAPPREASYCESIELGSLMSELAAYYDAFGYHPVAREAPDHVAVEVGFLAYLRLKEAHALAVGDADRAGITAETAERFRAAHLAVLATPLAALLAESEIGYLAQASAQLAARVGPPPRRTFLPVIPHGDADADGSEFPCAERT